MTAQPGFEPHVTTLGQGARRVLALHCTMAFGGAWSGVAKALGNDLTFVAPDMPSHGKSPDWDGTSDFDATVFDAAASVLASGPMDVIGHSFGAATALRLAAEHPAMIRSLTLFEPVFFAVALADDPATLENHDTSVTPMFEALQKGDRMAAARAFNGMWSDGASWDRLPERSRQAMARAVHVVPDTRAFLYDDTRGLLRPGVLARFNKPTVLMRGSESLSAVACVNTGLARRFANASEAVIDGAGHMAPITHPAEVAKVIAGLLARS